MGYLMLSFLCLCVFDFKSVYTAPTAIGAMATTEINYIGGEDDMEYQEDFNSGDQWENCASDEYQCDNDECIPSIYRCDGVNDCEDTSDELHCAIVATIETATTTTTTVNNIGEVDDIDYLEDFYSGDQWENCASDEYQCDNDECIPSIYKCDGVNDCEDTSDELHCDPVTATIGESSTMNNLLQTTEATEDFTFQSTEAPVVNETTGQRQTSNCTTRFNLSAGDEMILTTPNYPNHYDSLLSCLWEVSVPDDVIISVEFRSFQTETKYDVMSAGHGLGPETGSIEISRHSGGELPRSFSGTPIVWISFTSDGSIEDVGFSASISAYQVSTQTSTVIKTTMRRQTSHCTRRFNITAGDTMSLTTPNFPNNYDSLLRCLWTISAPDNVIIRVAFLSFQTETLYDVMSAGSGLEPGNGSTLIPRHSGDELPMSFSWPSNVWISFTSDGSVEDVGFSARVSAYLESTAASPVTEATGQNSDCNRRLDLSAGRTLTLTTPNFPNYYDSLLNCFWTISVPDDVIINVDFRSFETEATYDVMSAGLGLGPETGSTVISRHSGGELPSSFSGSPSIWIRFTSDGSIEGLGFSANISAYQASTQASTVIETTMQRQTPSCTARFSLSAGDTMSLTTPNFPNHYDRLLSCLWTIYAPDNVIIIVDFLSFETEARYDVMSAGHGLGPETGSTLISRHSGGELPMSFSGSRNVWISFASDGSVEAYGFSANITAYQEPSEASVVSTNSAADIALFAERKSFAEAQTSCLENGMVLFKVPSESVHTELVSLLNSLGYSNIDVWINGYQRSENTWITTDGDDLTGYNLWAPGEPNGSGRCLQLWAALGHRWDDTPCSMMKAYICQSADPTEASAVSNTTSQRQAFNCTGRFNFSTVDTMILTTPNFPDQYYSSLDCLWTFSAPDDVIISVEFSSFTTEEGHDVVSAGLGLGPETGTTVIYRHSGDDLPRSFFGSPSVWIQFTSDWSIEDWGFSARVSVSQAADIVLFAVRKDFFAAQVSCRENGMILVKDLRESIHSQIISLLSSHGYSNTDVWINGYQNNDNTWVTTDGDDLTGYNHWAPGEPNGSGRCLQLWAALEHAWDDTPCSYTKPYICGPADSITSISPPNRLSSNSYQGTHVPPSYLPSVSSKLPEGLVQWLSPATSVVIESPNYPNPYDNNLERTWAVSTAEGYMLHNSFSSFDTEDKYDTLTVWEGLSPEDGIQLFQFSGSNLPNDFTVMSSSMHITFKSDFSVSRLGFQLTITSVQD